MFYSLCSIYSKNRHVVWSAAIINPILKVDTLVLIQLKFGLNWLRGFRGEDFVMLSHIVQIIFHKWLLIVMTAILFRHVGKFDEIFQEVNQKYFSTTFSLPIQHIC